MSRPAPKPGPVTRSGGFTLVEVLIVIVILGILAAVVVFAVGALSGQSRGAASAHESSIITTAEEAYFAEHGCYTDGPGLAAAGLLHGQPGYWTVTTTPGGCPGSYSLAPVSTTTSTTASSCSLSWAALNPSAVNRDSAGGGSAGALAADVVISAQTTGPCPAGSVTATFTPADGVARTVVLTGGGPWSYTIGRTTYTWQGGKTVYPIQVSAGAAPAQLPLTVCNANQPCP